MGVRSRAKDNAGRPCPYCRRMMISTSQASGLTGEDRWLAASIEHIQCRSNDGSNDPVNIIIACVRCNNLRGDLDYELYCEFARSVLQQYPNAPTIVLRKLLRNFVEALSVHSLNNSRAVKQAIRFTLLTNADTLHRINPAAPISQVEQLTLKREMLMQQIAELDAQIESVSGLGA